MMRGMFSRQTSRHHRPRDRRRSRSRSLPRASRTTRAPPARSLSPPRRPTRSRSGSRSISSGSPPDSLSGGSDYSHLSLRSQRSPPFMRRSLSFTGLHEDPFPYSRVSDFRPSSMRRSRSRSPRSRVRSASADRFAYESFEPRLPFQRRRAFDDFPLRFDERPPFNDSLFEEFEPPLPPHHQRRSRFDAHSRPHFTDHIPRFSMDRAMRFPARTPNIVFMQPRSFVFNIGSVSDNRIPLLQVIDEFDGRRVLYATGNFMQRSSHVRLHDDYSGELLRLSPRKSSSKSRRYAPLRVITFNKYRDPVMTAVSMRDAHGPAYPQGAAPPPFSFAPNANAYYPPQGAYPYSGPYPVPPYGAPGASYPDMHQSAANPVQPESNAPQPASGTGSDPYSAPWTNPQQQPQGVPVYPQPDQSRQPGQEYPQPQYQQWQGIYYQPNTGYPNQAYPQGYKPEMYANYMYAFGYQNNAGAPPFQPWDSSDQTTVVAEFFSGEKSMDEIRRSRRDGRRRHPLFRLTRSATREREWIQTSTSRELASITYSTPGSDGFAIEGSSYRVMVQPGVDLTMITSAIVSRIIMWAGGDERF